MGAEAETREGEEGRVAADEEGDNEEEEEKEEEEEEEEAEEEFSPEGDAGTLTAGGFAELLAVDAFDVLLGLKISLTSSSSRP